MLYVLRTRIIEIQYWDFLYTQNTSLRRIDIWQQKPQKIAVLH